MMNLTFVRIPKEEVRRILLIVLGLEVLLFLLPTTGKVEGLAVGYWQGVKLRLLSGNYWGIAILSGIGAGLLLTGLIVFSGYLSRFTDRSSASNQGQSPDRRSFR
jgi:hypothetical protein